MILSSCGVAAMGDEIPLYSFINLAMDKCEWPLKRLEDVKKGAFLLKNDL
jgi:hypothetical protein